jgi:hypothetical protein
MIKLHVQLNPSNNLLVQSKNIISSQTSGPLKINTLCPIKTSTTEYQVRGIISHKNVVLSHTAIKTLDAHSFPYMEC